MAFGLKLLAFRMNFSFRVSWYFEIIFAWKLLTDSLECTVENIKEEDIFP